MMYNLKNFFLLALTLLEGSVVLAPLYQSGVHCKNVPGILPALCHLMLINNSVWWLYNVHMLLSYVPVNFQDFVSLFVPRSR